MKKKLIFKNLTYAPIDKDLIDLSLLNSHEKDYLLKYNLDTHGSSRSYGNKSISPSTKSISSDFTNWINVLLIFYHIALESSKTINIFLVYQMNPDEYFRSVV